MSDDDDVVGHALLLAGDFRELPAHEALDGEHRVFGVGDGLTLGHLPYQPLAFFGERDDGRRDPRAFLIDEHGGLSAFHDRDHGVGRPEVDSNDFFCVGFCHAL